MTLRRSSDENVMIVSSNSDVLLSSSNGRRLACFSLTVGAAMVCQHIRTVVQ